MEVGEVGLKEQRRDSGKQKMFQGKLNRVARAMEAPCAFGFVFIGGGGRRFFFGGSGMSSI